MNDLGVCGWVVAPSGTGYNETALCTALVQRRQSGAVSQILSCKNQAYAGLLTAAVSRTLTPAGIEALTGSLRRQDGPPHTTSLSLGGFTSGSSCGLSGSGPPSRSRR
jgi:hypothetical protein